MHVSIVIFSYIFIYDTRRKKIKGNGEELEILLFSYMFTESYFFSSEINWKPAGLKYPPPCQQNTKL